MKHTIITWTIRSVGSLSSTLDNIIKANYTIVSVVPTEYSNVQTGPNVITEAIIIIAKEEEQVSATEM